MDINDGTLDYEWRNPVRVSFYGSLDPCFFFPDFMAKFRSNPIKQPEYCFFDWEQLTMTINRIMRVRKVNMVLKMSIHVTNMFIIYVDTVRFI